MSSAFNHRISASALTKPFGAALALSCAIVSLSSGPAFAVQKVMTSTGITAEAPMPDAPPLARDLPRHQVEVVVVWGFRLRTTEHDLRMASVRSGYGELIDKTACMTATCGFVVVQDGAKWRATNVIAASEGELRDLQQNMEREGSTLVIVHPTGVKRTIPNF